MKVVQVNCSAYGSTGNIAKSIHRKLLEMGEESYIFFGIGKPTEKNMFRIGNDFTLHTHSVLSRYSGKQGYFSLLPTVKMISKIKKIKPDIIHIHNLHGSYLNIPIFFSYLKRTNVKVIITLHDCWLFTGKCPHFTAAGCDKWKESCGNCPQLSSYPRSKVDTTSNNLSDKKKWLSGFGDRLRIVAVSDWLRDTASKSFLSQYSIETIHNGVDTDIFHPMDGEKVRNKYNLGNKYVILGVSSNWNNSKGLNEFINLSQQISEDEVIVLVGLTEAQKKQMPLNINGISRMENQMELAELYSAADVFINPSKEETFGLVTAEAMACGTPVIVYNSTACAEIVDEKQGLILSPYDTKTLKDAIDSIKQIKRFATCKEYTIVKMVEEYISEYKKCIET